MKKQIAVLVVIVSLIGGCAISPKFTPTTMKGAECKRECALRQQACVASSYTCDQGYSSCIESCIDIDRLSKQKELE